MQVWTIKRPARDVTRTCLKWFAVDVGSERDATGERSVSLAKRCGVLHPHTSCHHQVVVIKSKHQSQHKCNRILGTQHIW